MEERSFPIPTAFMYTGGGGVHLYYSIEHLLPSVSSGVKGLSLLMSGALRSMIEKINECDLAYVGIKQYDLDLHKSIDLTNFNEEIIELD